MFANGVDPIKFFGVNLQKLFFVSWTSGTEHFKNVDNGLNTNIYSYLQTSVHPSSNLYLNVGHFFKGKLQTLD